MDGLLLEDFIAESEEENISAETERDDLKQLLLEANLKVKRKGFQWLIWARSSNKSKGNPKKITIYSWNSTYRIKQKIRFLSKLLGDHVGGSIEYSSIRDKVRIYCQFYCPRVSGFVYNSHRGKLKGVDP